MWRQPSRRRIRPTARRSRPTSRPAVRRAPPIRLWRRPRRRSQRWMRPTRRSTACSSARSPSKSPSDEWTPRLVRGVCFSVADQGGPPGKTPAKGLEQEQVAAPDAPVTDGEIQSKRHRGSRGIAVILNGDDHALHRKLQLACDRLNDAQVGLMGNEPADGGTLEAIGGELLIDGLAQGADR